MTRRSATTTTRVLVFLVLIAVAAVLPSAGAAGLDQDMDPYGQYLNTIDDTAKVWLKGQTVVMTGPIGCPEGLVVEIRIKVSQESGAVGEGHYNAFCTGEQEEWMALVNTWSFPFTPGAAEARAWATTWDKNGAVKSWNWGKEITLKGM